MATVGDPLCDESVLVQEGRNNSLGDIMTPAQRDFTAVFYYVGLAIYIVCFAVWIALKNRFQRTRVRPTSFLILAILAGLALQSCGPLQIMAGERYPCWLGVLLLLLLVPVATGSVLFRYMLFAFLIRFGEGMTKVQAKLELETEQSISNSSTVTDYIRSRWGRLKAIATILVTARPVQTESELYDLKFIVSKKGLFSMLFLFMIPVLIMVIAMFVSDPVLTHCYNCGYGEATQTVIIILCILFICVSVFFWYQARKTKAEDKWHIKSECTYSIVCIIIGFIGYLVSIFDMDQLDLSPYHHQFQMCAGIWLLVINQSVVQIFLAWREEKRMDQLQWHITEQRKTSSTQGLVDDLDVILNDKGLADLFEKHLIAEFGAESLFFLRQAQEWKRLYFDVSSNTRLNRARKVNKLYIDTNGLYSVNVPAGIVERIKRKLYADNADDCPREIFDEAVEEIRHLLATGAVLRFRTSDQYKTFLRGTGSNLSAATSVILPAAGSV